MKRIGSRIAGWLWRRWHGDRQARHHDSGDAVNTDTDRSNRHDGKVRRPHSCSKQQ